jgi:hypothetical protein
MNHFFPDLMKELDLLPDARKRKQYQTAELGMAAITLFLFKQGSRNAYNNDRKEKQFLDNYQKLFDMSLPHLDTPDEFFRDLHDDGLEQIKARMVSRLIRNKVIEAEKFRGYYVVAIDGTGIASYNKRHCDCCLTKTSKNGVTTYFHNVLEAKLLTPSGLSLSMATEWINNEGKDEYEKQDCEREAFKRLAKKLKKLYPRLPIVITADGLYPWDGFFEICGQNIWKYIVVLKDGSLKSFQEEVYVEKMIAQKQITDVKRAAKNKLITLNYQWLKELPYRKHRINYVECHETTVFVKSKTTSLQRFVHITNFDVGSKLCDGISFTGRLRQKIENEGFNTQKNQGYALEHKFSRVSFQAMKNYYQCLQIAHIINQLVEASQTIKTVKDKVLKCTIKYLWKRLLSHLLENIIDENEIHALVSKPFQIRLA